MSTKKRRGNIIPFVRKVDINVGFVVFVIIFLYIIVSFIIFLVSKQAVIYEVAAGSIAKDDSCSGVILRNESVVKSSFSGSINFMTTSGDRGGSDTIVCSVDEAGRVSALIDEYIKQELSENCINDIGTNILQYAVSMANGEFGEIYNLRDSINDIIVQSRNDDLTGVLDDYITQTNSENLFHKIYPDKIGTIGYFIDGYENLTEADIKMSLFDKSGYDTSNKLKNTIVNRGDDIYKLVYDDNWYIYIPVTKEDANYYQESGDVLHIEFADKNISLNAPFTIYCNNEKENFIKISMSKYMVDYIDSRFVNLKIETNSKSGLKIPVSSVFTKNFFTIPMEYLNGTNSFVRKYYNEKGVETIETVETTLIGCDDKFYYVDMNDFSNGDLIMKADSDETYAIGTIGELSGVYCVNRGYAAFKKIEVIDSNDEYYIIKKNTKFGLSQYDHIILDHTTAKENQLF